MEDRTNAQVRSPSDAEIREQLDRLNVSPESNLISVLQDIQDALGYLPAPALQEVSLRTKVPLSRIHGVVSFYEQFHTEPRGRHTVRCCRGTACHVRGGKGVINAVQNALGVDDGETTGNMSFTFETVACLGACALAPVMVVDETYYGKVTTERAQQVLEYIAEEKT